MLHTFDKPRHPVTGIKCFPLCTRDFTDAMAVIYYPDTNKLSALGQVPAHSNPCGGIAKNARRVFRRYLAEQELRRLGRALGEVEESEPARVGAIRLLLYTGCRKGEVLSLRWSDVAGRLMTLRDSKTGPRQVDLGPAAQEALRRVSRVPGNPWVFTSSRRAGQPLTELLPFWYDVVLPLAKIAVNRRAKLTPDRRRTLTPMGCGSGLSR